jgi:hypothetical protein
LLLSLRCLKPSVFFPTRLFGSVPGGLLLLRYPAFRFPPSCFRSLGLLALRPSPFSFEALFLSPDGLGTLSFEALGLAAGSFLAFGFHPCGFSACRFGSSGISILLADRLQSGLLVSGFFLATYPLEPFGFAFGPLARSLSFRFFLALGL